MPTLSDILSASIDGRSHLLRLEEASDLEGTRARIGRGRRIRVAATTSVGVVALAGVTSAAITWGPRLMEPAAPEPGDTASVTTSIDEVRRDIFEPLSSRVQCGDPAPTPLTFSDGFSLDISDKATDDTWVTALSKYTGTVVDGVSPQVGYAVIVKDGIVQAVVVSQGSSFGVEVDEMGEVTRSVMGADSLAEGQTIDSSWSGVAIAAQVDPAGLEIGATCVNGFDFAEDEQATLPAGDYLVYVVQAIKKSPLDTALRALRGRGYEFAPEFGTWTPGSIDCDRSLYQVQQQWTDLAPVECEPLGVDGVTFDGKGNVTIDYIVDRGPQELDLMLVSSPVPLTLSDDVTIRSPFPSASTIIDPSPSTELECGATIDNSYSSSLSAEFAGDHSAGLDELRSAAGAGVLLDTGTTSEVQVGHVELPTEATAWLMASRGGQAVVVGSAPASMGDGDPLPIDRSVGKAPTMVRLGEPQWCEFPDTGVDGYLKTGDVTAMIIEGEFTGVSDTGATEVTPMVYLDWAHTEG